MRGQIELNKTKLLEFIKSARKHIKYIDIIMKMPEGEKRGRLIAAEMNRFNFDFDAFAHFQLHIPLDKMDKITGVSFKLPKIK